jgi:phage tail sheath gpL-like
MSINFTYYDVNNRVPGVYVEMDPSQANSATQLQNSLLFGQIRSGTGGGTGTPNVPVLVESKAQVLQLCGQGSMLANMAQRYLARDPFGPLYIVPLADVTAGVAAGGEITITGTATAAGTANCYIGGIRTQCAIASGDAAPAIATKLVAAINANPDVEVAAAVDGTDTDQINLTARFKGQAGNGIDVRFDYYGTLGGEYGVRGVSFGVTPMSGGTSNPPLDAALANLSDTSFDFICLPYTDTTSLNAMQAFLDDQAGRWSWEQMIYGGAFSAFMGTLGACTTFGQSRNDQHMSIMAYNDSPDPPWIWAAEMMAYAASSLRVDPGLPLQYMATTLKAPPVHSRWTIGERNTLLYDGLSTFRVNEAGQVIMERMCTTYQRNAAGAVDNSYLDVETMYGLMFVSRDLTTFLLSRYMRKKLVSDTTPIAPGSNCVNALMIKASVIQEYRVLQMNGFVQNADTFARNIIVENAGNGLVKILAPVDLVNQLRQIAILLQFRKS